MPRFKLISFPLCPYVQRAAIALAEKGVAFERVDIDLSDKPEWFLKLSPLGKVPVLVVTLDDGSEQVLFESQVIAEYLDETIAPQLHPADPLGRASHRAWIEFASAALADLFGFYTGDREIYREKLQALDAKFRRLEQVLGEGPFFAGDRFSLVDAAFAPVFRYFDTFDGLVEHGLLAGRPKLQAWRDQLAARPSVRNAAPADYAERLRAFVIAKNGHLASLAKEPALA
jgi:glutathione S-transferase